MERIVRQKQDNNKQNQECNVLKMCALREAENSKISLSLRQILERTRCISASFLFICHSNSQCPPSGPKESADTSKGIRAMA